VKSLPNPPCGDESLAVSELLENVSASDSALITGVELVSPAGLTITGTYILEDEADWMPGAGFQVPPRPEDEWLGRWAHRQDARGFTVEAGEVVNLLIAVRPDDLVVGGSFDGYRVSYETDGDQRTTDTVPFTMEIPPDASGGQATCTEVLD
jgi:hypothetical protein